MMTSSIKVVFCLAPALVSTVLLHGCGGGGGNGGNSGNCSSWDPSTGTEASCEALAGCQWAPGVSDACQNPDQQADPSAAYAVLDQLDESEEECKKISGATYGHFCVSKCDLYGEPNIPTLSYEKAEKMLWTPILPRPDQTATADQSEEGVRNLSLDQVLMDLIPEKITYQQLAAAPPEYGGTKEEWAALSPESGKRCTAYVYSEKHTKNNGSHYYKVFLVFKYQPFGLNVFDYTDCVPKGGNSINLPNAAEIPQDAWGQLKVVQTSNNTYQNCVSHSNGSSTGCAIANRNGDLFCADPPEICEDINGIEDAGEREEVCAQNSNCNFEVQQCLSKPAFPTCDSAPSNECPQYCEDSGAANTCTLPNLPDGFCAAPDAQDQCTSYFDENGDVVSLPQFAEDLCQQGSLPPTCTRKP